jgi:hypothetical protein
MSRAWTSVADRWHTFRAEHWAAFLVLLFGIGLRISQYPDSAYRLASGVASGSMRGSFDSIRPDQAVAVSDRFLAIAITERDLFNE